METSPTLISMNSCNPLVRWTLTQTLLVVQVEKKKVGDIKFPMREVRFCKKSQKGTCKPKNSIYIGTFSSVWSLAIKSRV